MKKRKLLYLFCALLVFIFSCTKVEVVEKPQTPIPIDTSTIRNFKLVFENITNSQMDFNKLTAVITLEDAQQKEVKVSSPIVYENLFRTFQLGLPKGNYRIKKLLIMDDKQMAKFVIPIAGSFKASLVTKPLSIALELNDKVEKQVPVSVLAVEDTDIPQQYGYAEGSFGARNPGQPNPEMDKPVFIKPIIKIGNIVYDSVPVHLVIRSWDAKNEMTYSAASLQAGRQRIYLSAKAVKYQLSIAKWGTYDELILNKNDVQENAVYTMGGAVSAKKLKSVIELKITDEKSVPVTKTDFIYGSDAAIKETIVWGKNTEMATILLQKNLFETNNDKVVNIKSFDAKNTLQKTLNVQYNNLGKITFMEETEGLYYTRANISYVPLDTWVGISQDYRVDVLYNSNKEFYTSNYSITMHGGTMMQDTKQSSNGMIEEGIYTNDLCINPFVHLGIPNLLLTQINKHNINMQWKNWLQGFPQIEAYEFSYKYDVGGYPTEQLVKFRSFSTKQHLYSLRYAFEYN